MMKLLSFLFHPSTLIAMFAAASMWFFVHTMQVNKDLKEDLGKARGEITQLQDSMKLQKEDMESLMEMTKNNAKVRQREADVNAKIAQIPKTSIDRPFSNPDLLDAARVLRDYQSSEQSTPSDGN